MNNIKGRLSTDTRDILSLCQDIKKGDIKIPQFQRRFIWKEEQAIDLLDSIASNYPVGSLLLWKTKTKVKKERNIGDFNLPDTDDIDPTDYVLDGQQRLTVIYSCFGAKESDLGFSAAYDLDKEKFIKIPKQMHVTIFPLRKLYDTTSLLNFRAGLQTHPNSSALQFKLDTLIGTLSQYKIPVVTLKELTVEEVCPIFERVNSSGTVLSTYDLMVAATWSEKFDLNEHVESIRNSLKTKGFEEIEKGAVLKCLAAIQKKDVRKPSILALRELNPDEMKSLVEKTKQSLKKTVDLLSTEFLIYNVEFNPYEAIVVILNYIYSDHTSLDSNQALRARQWFWRSSFSLRYRGASESLVTDDMDKVHKFILNGIGNPGQFGSVPDISVWKEAEFRSNNSRAKAFILALASKKPRNITNGVIIDIKEAISEYNKKEFHHIFPKAYLKTIGVDDPNSIANICMLASSENKVVSDANPNSYFPQYITQLADSSEAVFLSNLLPDPKSFHYSNCTYDEFLTARSLIINEFIKNLCDGIIS